MSPVVKDAHVTRDDDPAQFDPFVVCDVCGEKLCTIEEGDSISTLASVVSEHECAPGGVRGTRVDPIYGTTIYTLTFPTHVVTYTAKPYPAKPIGYADLNCHARTNISGVMGSTGEPCEFLGNETTCWFDGTGLAPVLEDEDAIYALMERYWPQVSS